MNTSFNLDKLELMRLNDAHDNNFRKEMRKRLLAKVGKIHIYKPIKNKKLVGFFTSLDEWKTLNRWIIEETTETIKPTIRDAVLTILGYEER